MSILHGKILRAKALLAEQNTPTDTITNPLDRIGKPPPVPTKRPVPTRSSQGKIRTRGRPRSSLARRELELRPIKQWLHQCLRPEPGAMEFVGELRFRFVLTTSGQRVRVKTEYARQTLAESYLDYCRTNGYQPMLPRTFSALVLEALLGLGWDCRFAKALDSRRVTISGVALVGQTIFDGEDRRYGDDDRRRWARKSA
jgi:hypothetical protein